MLLGHLQESENRARHLEHEMYVENDETACLRRENSELEGRNFQLKLEGVQQGQELIQTQNLLRSAGEHFLNFLAAKNG
jgi:predicted  nucleic acid-binding Zn-ribbon protein